MGSFIKCCCLSLSVIVFLTLSVFLVGSIHSGPGRLCVFFSYPVTLKVLQLLILIVRQAKGLTVILTHYSFIEWVWAEVTPICVQHGQSCLLIKMAAACQGKVKVYLSNTNQIHKTMKFQILKHILKNKAMHYVVPLQLLKRFFPKSWTDTNNYLLTLMSFHTCRTFFYGFFVDFHCMD